MSERLDGLRRIKWEARVAARRLAKRRLRGSADLPVVFGNALAKSGSHVLSQLLEGLSTITPLVYTDMNPIRTRLPGCGARQQSEVLRDLHRLHRGDIGWGYLPSVPAYLQALSSTAHLVIFIIRDPRDKIISQIHYATTMHPGHSLRAHYTSLPTMEERIMAAIHGVPGLSKSIRDIYASYQGWLNHPNAHVVRFEGMMLDRPAAISGVLDRLQAMGLAPDIGRQQAIGVLDEAMSPARSPTYRSGRAGSWRGEFSKTNVIEFKQATGDLLQRWGYEPDSDWGL